jgi:hypothetical protein
MTVQDQTMEDSARVKENSTKSDTARRQHVLFAKYQLQSRPHQPKKKLYAAKFSLNFVGTSNYGLHLDGDRQLLAFSRSTSLLLMAPSEKRRHNNGIGYLAWLDIGDSELTVELNI